jgi:hypothetical protein
LSRSLSLSLACSLSLSLALSLSLYSHQIMYCMSSSVILHSVSTPNIVECTS